MSNIEHFKLIIGESLIWNNWRAEHPGVMLDLSEHNLQAFNFNYYGVNFNFSDHPKSELFDKEKKFSFVDFSRANLSHSKLLGKDCSRSLFIEAFLRSIDFLGSNLSETNFLSANLIEANLFAVSLFRANLRNANLTSADLSYADLREADLQGADFSKVNLSRANLMGANTENTNFTETIFFETIMSDGSIHSANVPAQRFVWGENARFLIEKAIYQWNIKKIDNPELMVDLGNEVIKQASLDRANLSGIAFFKARLPASSFSEANLEGTRFEEANLKRSKFMFANLHRVSFKNSNLVAAYFRNANLTEADLCGADFQGADLREANLQGANIEGTNFNSATFCGTIMPDGSINNSDCWQPPED